MQNEPQLSAEMKKRFYDEFVYIETNNDEGGHYDYPSLNTSSPIEIKHFLATALEEQKKAILAEVESWLVDEEEEVAFVPGRNAIRNQLKSELRAKVQEMKGKTV